MKIALAQLNYHIGNFKSNMELILKEVNSAKTAGADLIIFAELAICGYPPKDFLEFESFISDCENAIYEIAEACHGIAAIIGAPSKSKLKRGKRLHNSAYFLANGVVQSVHHKTLLPTYDVFDENRYFESAKEHDLIEYKGKTIAITICEDLWNIEGDMKYSTSPTELLDLKRADFMVNIAASPFSYQQQKERQKVLSWNAKKYQLPIFYVNHIGAQTELIFDGGSCVVNKLGELCAELAYFESETVVFDIENLPSAHQLQEKLKIEKMYHALVLGVRDYFVKSNFSKAIIGLSGGIDSALTLAIAVEALGKENVKSVLLPSKYSSDHSINDSIELCKNLDSPYETISIEEVVKSFNLSLSNSFQGLKEDVTEENIQARARGVILMAMSNKFGNILLNTSNKSEMAVGYGTLYGDMCGGLSVIGDVYKTEVFEMCRFINRNKEIIPESIITKPPSAELRPDQKDSDSLPDYKVLDAILFQYIECSKSGNKIINQGFEEDTVKRSIQLVNRNEYKRYQAAPILRVSPRAFGMGRLMPLVGEYTFNN
ncbi:NAD+ synthase [Vicingaceae bacterium]|nr:NAD+ synthase [Vicingaceae bacterium]